MQAPFDRDGKGLRRCAYKIHIVRNCRGNSGRECGPIQRCRGPFDRKRQDWQCLLRVQEEVASDHDLMQAVIHNSELDGHQLAARDFVDAALSFWAKHVGMPIHD